MIPIGPTAPTFGPAIKGSCVGVTRLLSAVQVQAASSNKVYQLLVHGWWFSPGTPASSTTKTGRHDIAEILLKVALKHQKSIKIKYTRQHTPGFTDNGINWARTSNGRP